MRKNFLALGILFSAFFGLNASTVLAEEIENPRITTSSNYLNFMWDSLPSSVMDNADGYAIQFSDKQDAIDINKPANFYTSNAIGKSLRRNSFENNTYYFLRIYTYTTEDEGGKLLGNGSKMLKWKIDYRDEVTSEEIAVTDTINTSSSSSDSTSSTDSFEFGQVRVVEYDNFADFRWSRPYGMASTDYDGFLIAVSKNADMSDPLIETELAKNKFSVRVKGFEPETQYYARGYFYNERGGENIKFGDSPIKSFKTIKAINRSANTRAARNMKKIERRAITSVTIEGSTSTTTTSTTENDEDTTETTTTEEVDLTSQTSIQKRINEIRTQINKLQAEMNRLKAKLKTGTSSAKTSTSSTSSSSKMSLRERLKAILAKKRAQK